MKSGVLFIDEEKKEKKQKQKQMKENYLPGTLYQVSRMKTSVKNKNEKPETVRDRIR